MKKDKITIKEISKMLNLSEAVLRVHLACVDKHRIVSINPLTFNYNYNFLQSLRNFYFEKSQSLGKKYEKYNDTVKKIDKIIKLYKKANNIDKSL